jgi:ribosomal protein S12 methylthiotransferase accessory factor
VKPAELRQLVGPLADLVSNRTGIIRSVSRAQRGAEEPCPPVVYQAEVSHFDFRLADARDRTAAGKGATKEAAIRGAIGEAMERYCASQVDPGLPFTAAWLALASQAVSPSDFVLYSASQYESHQLPYHRWTRDDEITWLPGHELPSNRVVFVPASLIYLQFPNGHRQEALTSPSSNGLAAGPDLDSAVLHALHECIERDAFLITWMARLPAPEVHFAGAIPLATSIHDHYLRYGVKLRVFRMYSDIAAHTMLAVALDQTGSGPAAVIGLGCDASPSRALLKALFEICQAHTGEVRRYREEPPNVRLKRPEDVRTLEDHSAWFTIPEHLNGLSFLLENGRSEHLADLPDYAASNVQLALDNCVASLNKAGCTALYVDLTTPDLASYQLKVVRAVATGLQPIHFGWGQERLGGRRLFELPLKLGFATRPLLENELNPLPHPLA